MENLDVRELVFDERLRYRDIAREMRISRCWLSTLMSRGPLSAENKLQILAAVARLRERREAASDG